MRSDAEGNSVNCGAPACIELQVGASLAGKLSNEASLTSSRSGGVVLAADDSLSVSIVYSPGLRRSMRVGTCMSSRETRINVRCEPSALRNALSTMILPVGSLTRYPSHSVSVDGVRSNAGT